jgi:hypothetical protein
VRECSETHRGGRVIREFPETLPTVASDDILNWWRPVLSRFRPAGCPSCREAIGHSIVATYVHDNINSIHGRGESEVIRPPLQVSKEFINLVHPGAGVKVGIESGQTHLMNPGPIIQVPPRLRLDFFQVPRASRGVPATNELHPQLHRHGLSHPTDRTQRAPPGRTVLDPYLRTSTLHNRAHIQQFFNAQSCPSPPRLDGIHQSDGAVRLQLHM